MNSALQEAAAWREIARRVSLSDYSQYLCWYLRASTVYTLGNGPSLGKGVAAAMVARLRPHLRGVPGFPGHSPRLSGMRGEESAARWNADRSTFCLFLALEAEDEARAASPKKRAVEVGKPRSER